MSGWQLESYWFITWASSLWVGGGWRAIGSSPGPHLYGWVKVGELLVHHLGLIFMGGWRLESYWFITWASSLWVGGGWRAIGSSPGRHLYGWVKVGELLVHHLGLIFMGGWRLEIYWFITWASSLWVGGGWRAVSSSQWPHLYGWVEVGELLVIHLGLIFMCGWRLESYWFITWASSLWVRGSWRAIVHHLCLIFMSG